MKRKYKNELDNYSEKFQAYTHLFLSIDISLTVSLDYGSN